MDLLGEIVARNWLLIGFRVAFLLGIEAFA
jgi:hypothetical protein